MVLRERIELSTSPLPRECSTTELPQHFSTFALPCAILLENRQESIYAFLKEKTSCIMPYIFIQQHWLYTNNTELFKGKLNTA